MPYKEIILIVSKLHVTNISRDAFMPISKSLRMFHTINRLKEKIGEWSSS